MIKTLLGYRIDELHSCYVEVLCPGVLHHGVHNELLNKVPVMKGYVFWKRDTRENQEWYDFAPYVEAERMWREVSE